MPLCEIAFEGSPVIALPSKMMRPEVGRSTPVKQLKNVLLPAPFGPMMARTSSRASSKLTADSAANPQKRTDNSSVFSTGAAAAPRSIAGEPVEGSGLTYAENEQAGGTIVLSLSTVARSL